MRPRAPTLTATAEQESSYLDHAHDGPPEIGADDDVYGQYTLARYSVQNDHYNGLYRQWAKPIYFLVGKQWLRWDGQQLSYVLDTDVPEWRQQPVTNYTFATYRIALSKLTKQKPTLEVVPPSGDSEDREAAQLGEAILEYLWRQLKSPRKVKLAIGWLLVAGVVFLEAEWDPNGGDLKPQSVLVEAIDSENPTGDTVDVDCACDEKGEPYRRAPQSQDDKALDGGDPYDLEREPEQVRTGELVFNVVDPMSVRYNPEATSEDDADEMFIAKSWPIRKACQVYGLDENEITNTGGSASDERDDLENFLSSVTAGAPDPFNTQAQQVGSSQDEGIGQRVLVMRYYAKQDDDHPEGRHWITVGGKKVWPLKGDKEFPEGEAPLPFGFWPPLVPIVDTPIPGQPQGIGLLGQVVPINEQINYHDGKIGEYHTTMAMGGVIWVAPADRGITITSEPGQVKVSKAYGETGKHPMREKLEGLPAGVYAERQVLEGKLRTVAGLSGVDMAQKPEGVTAGRAFLVLQEASDAPYMPTLNAIEEALCEIGRRQLVIVQQRYTEERVIKIRGGKGKWEFRSFRGSDLRDGMDVRVQTGSMYPWSKSAQWDTKLSVLQALPQLVLKPDGTIDKQQLNRYLDSGVPGMQAFESEEDPDLIEIEREHAMFEAYDPMSPDGSNQLPQLGFWQNLPIHQKYHFEFLKKDRARFERWSAAAQEAFIEHCRLTTEAVDQIAASMVQPPGGGQPGAQPAAGGGPPAPGEPQTGKDVSVVPGGGAQGRLQTPTANKGKKSQLQLTAADHQAAGQ